MLIQFPVGTIGDTIGWFPDKPSCMSRSICIAVAGRYQSPGNPSDLARLGPFGNVERPVCPNADVMSSACGNFGPRADTRADRAHLGKARIGLRLGATSDLRPWDLPSKPKRMRWKTYSQLVRRYVAYQLVLEYLGRPPPT